MPHLIIDYSENLTDSMQELKIPEALHEAVMHCGLFEPNAVKTRSYPAKDFLVGNKGLQGKFVHISLSILSGRTIDQRQALSQSLISLLKTKLKDVDSLTVEIREMKRDVYQKISTV